MNYSLDDVRGAFDRINVHPRSIAIDRKGVVLPAGGHFQGIQRLGESPRLVVTSCSDSQAYFVLCDMVGDWAHGRAHAPVSLASRPLKHAGGCQTGTSAEISGCRARRLGDRRSFYATPTTTRLRYPANSLTVQPLPFG